MAALDWSQCPVVESISGKVSGALGAPGHRYTGEGFVRKPRSRDEHRKEVIEQFPVTREQLDSLMAFVARSLEKAPSFE